MLKFWIILLFIVVGCSDPVGPTPCPEGTRPWSYSETDSLGVEVIHETGCATDEEIADRFAKCLAGDCNFTK